MSVDNLRDQVKYCGLDRGKLFSSLLLITLGGAVASSSDETPPPEATNVTVTWGRSFSFRCIPTEEQGKFPWHNSTYTWENGSRHTIANAFPASVKYKNDSWEFNRTDGMLTLLRADHRYTGALTCKYAHFGSAQTRETKYNVYVIDRPLEIDIFCDEECSRSSRYNVTVPNSMENVNATCAKYGVTNHRQLGLRANVTFGKGTIRMASQLEEDSNADGSSSARLQFEVTLNGKEEVEVSCSLTDNDTEVENTTLVISREGTSANNARRNGLLAAWLAVLLGFVIVLVGTNRRRSP